MPFVFSGIVHHIDHCTLDMNATISTTVRMTECTTKAITINGGSLTGMAVSTGDVTVTAANGASIFATNLITNILTLNGGFASQRVHINGLRTNTSKVVVSGDFEEFYIDGMVLGRQGSSGPSQNLLEMSNVDGFRIEGILYRSAFHGAVFNTCTGGDIDLTIIDPGSQTDNTYDGFSLTGSCDQLKIRGAVRGAFAQANNPRYGVDVGASCLAIDVCLPISGTQTGNINDQTSGEVSVCLVSTTSTTGKDRQSQSLSDPGTATGTGSFRLYFKDAVTITGVSASLGTAPTGSSYLVDVNKNGTTIFTTQTNRPTILAGTNYDEATLEVVAVAAGDYLTVDIDQVGSTITGADLVVNIEWEA